MIMNHSARINGQTKTHQRTNDPVVWDPRVVTETVDNSANDPSESKSCGHLRIEESSRQEDGEEDSDALKSVLVNSLENI